MLRPLSNAHGIQRIHGIRILPLPSVRSVYSLGNCQAERQSLGTSGGDQREVSGLVPWTLTV
jgi:hypothetical protein